MTVVSIITALHNKGPYVAETIRSVLAQTVPDWEMIVVENGSADNGPDVVRQFSDPRIRLAISPKLGPGAARNFGLGLAIGEWILFLDADDLVEADYLAQKFEVAKTCPQAGIIAGRWQEFVEGRPEQMSLKTPAAYGCATTDLCNVAIAYAPWALHAAILRKTLIQSGGRWPEELDRLPSEDAAFWFSLICRTNVAWTTDAAAIYRVQTTNSRNEIAKVGDRARAAATTIEWNVRIWKELKEELTAEQSASIFRVFENLYRVALKERDRKAAQAILRQAAEKLKACSSNSLSIKARKVGGIRFFNLIRFGLV